ncbi:glycosyltransferase [Oryzicola mucosus]|uniref:Glycosyltransferase n=1 Tax=Oryzicola mucosus TaxID=2767425 RepID=A0A8J6PQZ4_9HYPH|nr:glycosyltransferase [Oryzicola mucosus]MBD0413474.1 glycosyltransferase [Oryzicola mucosus]
MAGEFVENYTFHKVSPMIGVLHVVPDLRRQAGGIAAAVTALAAALQDQGIVSRFLTRFLDDGSDLRRLTTIVSTTHLVHPLKRNVVLKQALEGFPPGMSFVVHSHGLWHPLNHAAVRSARKSAVGTVISVHGMLLPWARQHKNMRKDIAWALYQRRDLRTASAVHVTSQAEAEIVNAAVGMGQVREVPFGIDLPEAPTAMNLSGHERRLLFLGRLHPVKNLHTLIRAFAHAGSASWHLKLVGPDEDSHRSELESLIVSLGMHTRITIAGPAYGADKKLELAAAHALVLPSFTENFGVVVAEALAMGRPVLASTGTPWKAVESEGCGWWVDPALEGLERGIATLTSTPDSELAVMGARGMAWIRATLSWAKTSTEFTEIYQHAAGCSGVRQSFSGQ